MFVAIPVKTTALVSRYSRRVSKVVEKKPECLGLRTK